MENNTMKKIDEKNMTITYEDEKLTNKKVVYGSYAESTDTTIIFEDIINKENDTVIRTELKGFYYGKPEIDLIQEYYGELKAEFTM